MKNKKFHGFTLSPEVVEEFKNYAKTKGSNASYEIERLMRNELTKVKKTKISDMSGWTEERYVTHIKELQKHIQDLYDGRD